MMMHRRFLSLVTLFAAATITTDAKKLRGINSSQSHTFDELKRRVQNPILRPDIQGKTVRELAGRVAKGGEEVPTEQKGAVGDNKGERSLEEDAPTIEWGGRTIQFFTVYDEFGPSVSKMGETAGLNGLVYNMDRYAQGGQLGPEDVIGALKGSCSVVSTTNDHFCTYEILIAEEDGSTFGSTISSGALEYKPGGGGYLIVEAAGDAYQIYRGGVLELQYQTIGEQTIMTGELSLA